jgi:hypothetical protein
LTGKKFVQSWEAFGVTIANFVTALFGGIPATAALARTAFNVGFISLPRVLCPPSLIFFQIKTGASSRASGIMQALILFGVSYIALPLFMYGHYLTSSDLLRSCPYVLPYSHPSLRPRPSGLPAFRHSSSLTVLPPSHPSRPSSFLPFPLSNIPAFPFLLIFADIFCSQQ